ncbi:hypothetical protein NIES2100_43310 [Calothrix sp. NIES-2100]|uniref:hypothetical protein n=1 Tax=Calothrix sp. NIES-2100 TaxID=1954172 RepID=UPI000B61058C|nr:hypothetical protein NIES2100_43310 [Calothrix sp. NIES-2100]
MQQPNHQIAERLLRQRGYDNSAEMIRSVQEFITRYGQTPLQTMERLVQENQLVCLGEFHNYEGRYMHSELIEVAAAHGAKVLFVEVYADEQRTIDDFLQTGDFSRIAEFSEAKNANLAFQRPYVKMLETARVSGMKIVAVDINSDGATRDKHMAEAILNHFSDYPSDRGIFVAGQFHLMPRPFFVSTKSASTWLKETLTGGVVTIGRAYININEQSEELLNIWALMANASQPVIVPTQNSPFFKLPSTVRDNPLIGSDFDYLFLYPHPMGEKVEAIEQNKVSQEQQRFLAVATGSLQISPFAATELLSIKNLMAQIDKLDPLVKQGDEAARIEYERLAAEVLEHSRRYQQMTGGER